MNIQINRLSTGNKQEIIELFQNTFSDSEGETEGELLGALTADLSDMLGSESVSCLGAFASDKLIAAIFLTDLIFQQDFKVKMLAPVAVRTDFQRKGVGQKLILNAMQSLQASGVDLLVTYGDPNYYCKVGFQAMSEQDIPAPMPLSMPIGWLGKTLNNPIPSDLTTPSCVEPFTNQNLW
jgi:predicted N-acetyltransferase YhbS